MTRNPAGSALVPDVTGRNVPNPPTKASPSKPNAPPGEKANPLTPSCDLKVANALVSGGWSFQRNCGCSLVGSLNRLSVTGWPSKYSGQPYQAPCSTFTR